MVAELAAIGRAVAEAAGQPLPAVLAAATAPDAGQRAVAEALLAGPKRLVLLGALAERHPAYADLRAVAGAVATLAGATLGYLPGGGNAAGAALAGLLPHREAAGRPAAREGRDAGGMLAHGLDAYVLFGGIEPALDTGYAEAEASLAKARLRAGACRRSRRTSCGATRTWCCRSAPSPRPRAPSSTSRVAGRPSPRRRGWSARRGPGWKVLRVLGNLLDLPGFDYESSEDVRLELVAALGELYGRNADTAYGGRWRLQGPLPGSLAEAPIYQSDPLVRRAPALQQTRAAARPRAVY